METLACAAPVANSIRPGRATRKERIFYLWPPALTAAPLSVPRIICPECGFGSSGLLGQSLTRGGAQTRRRRDFTGRAAAFPSRRRAFAPRIHHRRVTFRPYPCYRFTAGRRNRGRAEGNLDEDEGQTIDAARRLVRKTATSGCGSRRSEE